MCADFVYVIAQNFLEKFLLAFWGHRKIIARCIPLLRLCGRAAADAAADAAVCQSLPAASPSSDFVGARRPTPLCAH